MYYGKTDDGPHAEKKFSLLGFATFLKPSKFLLGRPRVSVFQVGFPRFFKVELGKDLVLGRFLRMNEKFANLIFTKKIKRE